MKFTFYITLLFWVNALSAQDYSRKNRASIHMYAERMLSSKIADKAEDIAIRKGILFYYKELDIPGKYVHVSGGYSGDYKFSMWKMDNGDDLIGITNDICQPSCEYACSMFAFSDSDSTDVSAQVFPLKKMEKQMIKLSKKVLAQHPEITDQKAQYKFNLPKEGEPMLVYLSMDNNKIEVPLLQLVWNGKEFQISKKYKELPAS